MKTWAIVNTEGFVVHGFDGEEDFALDILDVISKMDPLPEWYEANLSVVEVPTDPRPVIGWYREADGSWVDTMPKLSLNRASIPADGSTAAIITFSQEGPNVPQEVEFRVNGSPVSEALSSNGTATCEVVSSNPGDVIVISADGAAVTVTVEG